MRVISTIEKTIKITECKTLNEDNSVFTIPQINQNIFMYKGLKKNVLGLYMLPQQQELCSMFSAQKTNKKSPSSLSVSSHSDNLIQKQAV